MRVEPDWALAPDWAQWFAIDSNGDMYWYDDEPKIVDDVWDGNDSGLLSFRDLVGTIIIINSKGIKIYEDYPAWRESLRRRPQ